MIAAILLACLVSNELLSCDLDPDAGRVRCPLSEIVLTSAMADVDGDGTPDRIAIVLKDGFYDAGPIEDFNCPAGYYGTLASRVSLHGSIVETSLGERGTCAGPWTLFLGDYNRDGQVDFNIGMQENSVSSFYSLFTIARDGRVTTLQVRHEDGSVDDSITAATTGNSTDFETSAEGIQVTTFANPPDPDVAFWTTLYRWNERESRFEEEETVEHP